MKNIADRLPADVPVLNNGAKNGVNREDISGLSLRLQLYLDQHPELTPEVVQQLSVVRALIQMDLESAA